MKISIITVCFNASEAIESTLKSIISQTHPDIEHIVIDGASTDGTLECIAAHGKHLTQMVSEPDCGIYDAMNKGICLATGEVVGILNAADVYANNTVLERVAHAMQSADIDALYGDVEFFSPSNPAKTVRRYNSRWFSPARLPWGWMPAHPALFLRRALFGRYGLYRTDFRIAGDYELIARIFKDGKCTYRYLPEVFVRMSAGGVSTGGWQNTLSLNFEVLRACRDNGINTNFFKLLSKYPLKALEFVLK